MSFDLFILLNKTGQNLQERWLEKMGSVGVDVKFPKGFVIGDENVQDIPLQIRFKPPLFNTVTVYESFDFNFGFTLISEEVRSEYLAGIEQSRLHKKIKSMNTELQLYSQSGRNDKALIAQCYLAACLVEAGDGVLVDPQEFGMVDGKYVYDVARAHCQAELNKINGVTANDVSDNKSSNSHQKIRPVKFWVLIFMALLAADGIWNVFLR